MQVGRLANKLAPTSPKFAARLSNSTLSSCMHSAHAYLPNERFPAFNFASYSRAYKGIRP